MRLDRFWISVAGACALAFIAGCGRSADQPAGDQQKLARQQRQAGIAMQINQIESSNLSPEEKQRLIDQVRASGRP